MMDETRMIETTTFVAGAVDYNNRPALRSNSGGWRSAALIIGVEITERFAYFGVSTNLITYLTGPLGESTAAGAVKVNAINGAGGFLTLVGALFGDAFLGRYRTILFALMLYILALGLLTFSTLLPSMLHSMSSSPPLSQVVLFYSSLCLITIAQAMHRPCTQAFGADQFDTQHPSESFAKSSFFNCWFFCSCFGVLVTSMIVVYVQDNLSWTLGFGIPCIAMEFSLLILLIGSKTYRYAVLEEEKGPLWRIVSNFWNKRGTSSIVTDAASNEALIASNDFEEHNSVCKEAKAIVRLIPIWMTCLIFGVIVAQATTFFTKQGATMERTIISGFKIPAATLQSLGTITILIFLPIYDRILVPIARGFTGKPSGITMLQRIGIGIFISMLSMIIAALVETRRLETAEENGLVNNSSSTLPMSVWWLVPQYVLLGIADVFTLVGLQEFFYDQVPMELKSLGLALFLSVIGIGSFFSSFLVWIINKATSRDGGYSWFSDNLNKGHLDYFYCLLAGLSALGFCSFLYFSRLYVYNHRRAL